VLAWFQDQNGNERIAVTHYLPNETNTHIAALKALVPAGQTVLECVYLTAGREQDPWSAAMIPAVERTIGMAPKVVRIDDYTQSDVANTTDDEAFQLIAERQADEQGVLRTVRIPLPEGDAYHSEF